MHSTRAGMGSLQGLVVCHVVRAKQSGVCTVPLYTPLVRVTKLVWSGFWWLVWVIQHVDNKKCDQVHFQLSSNGNGSMAGNFNENDADYVTSSVIEAGVLSF